MALIDALRDITGPANVLTGDETARYSHDWTGKYVWTPRAVVRPANREEVAATLRLCAEAGVPVVPTGGGTGLNGGTFAEGGVMLSLERMNRIREIRQALGDDATHPTYIETVPSVGYRFRAEVRA